MKLSDYQNEEALDLLADLMEPALVIFSDPEVKRLINEEEKKIKSVRYAIKAHKQEIMKILAIIDGVPVEEYKCNILTVPLKLIELLSDEELVSFFTTAVQSEQMSFGSVTANTEVDEE